MAAISKLRVWAGGNILTEDASVPDMDLNKQDEFPLISLEMMYRPKRDSETPLHSAWPENDRIILHVDLLRSVNSPRNGFSWSPNEKNPEWSKYMRFHWGKELTRRWLENPVGGSSRDFWLTCSPLWLDTLLSHQVQASFQVTSRSVVFITVLQVQKYSKSPSYNLESRRPFL